MLKRECITQTAVVITEPKGENVADFRDTLEPKTILECSGEAPQFSSILFPYFSVW